MALVKGPLFSLDAAGSVGDAIVFSTWKGRNYVRRHVKPSNPQSFAQIGRRAMFTFLAQDWSGLTTGEQATWQTLADQINASPFNGYMKGNMERWHEFLSPSQEVTAPGDNDGSDNVLTAVAWEQNRIKLTVAGSALLQAWGLIIFGAAGATVTPSVGTAVLVVPDTTIASHVYYHLPPSAVQGAQWTFDTIAFSDNGKKETAGGPQSTS